MADPVRKLTQIGDHHDQPDLETLRDNLPIFTEAEQIVDAYEAGINSQSQPSPSVSVQEAAQTLFTEIQRILPMTTNKNQNAFFAEKLSSLFMRTAQQTPSRHVGQELLVNTVRLIRNSPEEAWSDGFRKAQGMVMRDHWSGMSLAPRSLSDFPIRGVSLT